MMEKNTMLFLVALFSLFFFRENRACFTQNETHATGYLRSGEKHYLDCECKEPKLSTRNLKWYGPNDEEIKPAGLGTSEHLHTEWGHRNLGLFMPPLSKSLAGIYKCVSEGENGQKYVITYEVEVYDPLYFVNANDSQYLINGKDSMIFCEARGDTTPYMSWYRGQDYIEIADSNKYEILPVGLVIKNASNDDAGQYHCIARVKNTGEEGDRVIEVEVMTAPVITDIVAINDTVLIQGQNLTLDCNADAFPLPTYTWKRVDQPESLENVTWTQDLNKIRFENVTMDDQGTYECLVYNKAGEARKSIAIQILAPPKIQLFENVTAVEGSSVTIACEAIGRPQPYINITYYGPESDSPPDYNTTDDNPSYMALKLTFDKVQRFHEGLYDCNASNSIGFDIRSLYLTVLYKPFFEVTEETIWAWEDKTVNISCEHNSQPPALVEWRYYGNIVGKPTAEQIDVNQLWIAKLSKTTDHYIHFIPVKKMLHGTYECIVKNYLGDAKKVIHVKEGIKPPKIDYVNITDMAATSALFDIISPEYNGPPIIGYTAEYDEAESYNSTSIHMNRTWAAGIPYKIDKLKPMTKYLIKFAAINEGWTGPYGDYYAFETPEKSIPEPPTWDFNSDPVAISADNKILKLKSPEHNGDPIDYYAIKYCPVNGTADCIEHRISPTTELKLSHLDYNTSYLVEMVAHNSVGNSTPTSLQITIEGSNDQEASLPAGAIVGIAIAVVILAILLLDLLLLFTKKQGMVASCCYKKNKKKKVENLQSRDKKGLLKDNGESTGDTLKLPDNGHKEFEYNKTTGIITGKHSAV